MTTQSSAISAQGSTLGVASATAPSPVNIASVTVTASPSGTTTAFTTSTPHGLVDGALAALAAFSGADAALLNGQSFAISVTGPSAFTIPLNTNSKTITATSATVTGTAYLNVANFRTFNGLDGQASEIDVTNLASGAKEIRLGLVDFGQIQIELDHNLADAGQARLQAQYIAGALTPFVLSLPNGDTASFSAFVRKFSLQGGVDQVVRRQVDLRISGPVVWA